MIWTVELASYLDDAPWPATKEELIDCAKLLYKTQKAIASLPFIHEETNRIVHKNMRLGLGVTGVCAAAAARLRKGGAGWGGGV